MALIMASITNYFCHVLTFLLSLEKGSTHKVAVLKQKSEQKISGPNSMDTNDMVTEEEILDMFPEDKVENAE